MSEKTVTIKRIVLFVLFTFALSWIPAGLCDLLGILQDEAGFYFTTACMMFTPALGSLFTRFVTKEGMKNSLLRIRFKGYGKYYLLGIIIPLIYSLISAAAAVFVPDYSLNGDFLAEAGVSPIGYAAAIFFNIAAALALFPIYLGEELGWRGYLFPKLKTLMKRPAAYIVSGIVWGVWHTPAIIDGLNFGKDYAGYPFVGIALMCVFCTFTGIIFTWLTEKTDSVYPAAFAHAVNNNAAPLITSVTIGSDAVLLDFALGITGVFAVALFCLIENHLISQKQLRHR
ncbi:MAG: CPBP family intramembrane metalloprotease [Alistipes sp.]|nr:CPBP family intramembrane metalloprotease [Alistipes sp.]